MLQRAGRRNECAPLDIGIGLMYLPNIGVVNAIFLLHQFRRPCYIKSWGIKWPPWPPEFQRPCSSHFQRDTFSNHRITTIFKHLWSRFWHLFIACSLGNREVYFWKCIHVWKTFIFQQWIHIPHRYLHLAHFQDSLLDWRYQDQKGKYHPKQMHKAQV